MVEIDFVSWLAVAHQPRRFPVVDEKSSNLEVRRLPGCQSCRSSSIFLVSAIALAGLRPLGHTFEQFMIVWQR